MYIYFRNNKLVLLRKIDTFTLQIILSILMVIKKIFLLIPIYISSLTDHSCQQFILVIQKKQYSWRRPQGATVRCNALWVQID